MANLWKQFIDMLPKPKQFIAKIISINNDNTCVVELLSGDRLTVKGTGEVDKMYLVKDNIITTAMPTLTVYNETIN